VGWGGWGGVDNKLRVKKTKFKMRGKDFEKKLLIFGGPFKGEDNILWFMIYQNYFILKLGKTM